MPSVSKAQHNFMAAVANNPEFAKKAGVPQSVGKEFNNADKGKFSKGGNVMATKMNPGMLAIMAKEPKSLKENSKEGKAYDKKQMAMKKGGMPMVMKDGKKIPAFAAKKGGMPMKKMAMGGYAGGGSASKRSDGVAVKGKTKGMMMAKGGKSC